MYLVTRTRITKPVNDINSKIWRSPHTGHLAVTRANGRDQEQRILKHKEASEKLSLSNFLERVDCRFKALIYPVAPWQVVPDAYSPAQANARRLVNQVDLGSTWISMPPGDACAESDSATAVCRVRTGVPPVQCFDYCFVSQMTQFVMSQLTPRFVHTCM